MAVVLQPDLSHGVLERVAKRLPAEISEENASTVKGGGPRGLTLTKKHGQKHPVEKIEQAMEMMRRGENPFRVAKQLGIARTTLLYHLEKVPNHEFQIDVNPVLQNIFHQIELYYWKARLRIIKNIYHRSAKADDKTSTLMWEKLDKPPHPPMGSSPAQKNVFESATIDDKVTFREFVVERKGRDSKPENPPKVNLGDAGADSGNPVEAATAVGDGTQGKAG